MNALSAAQRLTILQRQDTHRHWRSLDDERICVVCHRLITGRNIRIAESSDGQQEVHCPTDGCRSTTRDWFYHGSGSAPSRPASSETPQKIEIDLGFA